MYTNRTCSNWNPNLYSKLDAMDYLWKAPAIKYVGGKSRRNKRKNKRKTRR